MKEDSIYPKSIFHLCDLKNLSLVSATSKQLSYHSIWKIEDYLLSSKICSKLISENLRKKYIYTQPWQK